MPVPGGRLTSSGCRARDARSGPAGHLFLTPRRSRAVPAGFSLTDVHVLDVFIVPNYAVGVLLEKYRKASLHVLGGTYLVRQCPSAMYMNAGPSQRYPTPRRGCST